MAQNLAADDRCARVQGEDVADERLRFTVSGHHVCNLNDTILIRFWKDSFASGAFDIEAEDSQWRHFSPFAVRRVRYDVVPGCVHFDLACRRPGNEYELG